MAGKSKMFTMATRDKVSSLLAAMPEKPKSERGMPTKEVINSLKSDIRAAQDKGYTLEEILTIFKEGGVEISLSTIKSSIKEGKKKISPVRRTSTRSSVNKLSDQELVSNSGQQLSSADSSQENRRSVPSSDAIAKQRRVDASLTPAAVRRGSR